MGVQRYRKKPVVIEAIRFDGENADQIARWVDPMSAEYELPDGWRVVQGTEDAESGLMVPTLEGDLMAKPGDWIIKGVKGEFYPCKPDIFSATYDPVVSPS